MLAEIILAGYCHQIKRFSLVNETHAVCCLMNCPRDPGPSGPHMLYVRATLEMSLKYLRVTDNPLVMAVSLCAEGIGCGSTGYHSALIIVTH